jgi:hypothetical protein
MRRLAEPAGALHAHRRENCGHAQDGREQHVGDEHAAGRPGGSRHRLQQVEHVPPPEPPFIHCHLHTVPFAGFVTHHLE